MQRMTDNALAQWVVRRPRISAWIVLAAGMVGLLVHEARNVGLLPSQWLALIVTTILVAGACIWIISWEDQDNPEEAAQADAADSEDEPLTDLLNPAPGARREQSESA